jgi:hypothetical protein
MMNRRSLAIALCLAAAGSALSAPGPFQSGPQVGERPLPFTSNIVTGPYRGKQHCYICGLKDEPAVLVFARRTDEATGKLIRDLRDSVRKYQDQKLFAWMVFLGATDTASETMLEKQAYEFARSNGASSLPVSALGDPQGPPGYLIHPEADVTVLMFRSGKVITNRAYRAKEWNGRAVDALLKDLPKFVAPS